MTNELLYKYYGENSELIKERALNAAYLEDFAKLPFVIVTSTSRIGDTIGQCFVRSGVKPNVFLYADYSLASFPICQKNLAACFITHMNLEPYLRDFSDNINIFPIYFQNQPVQLDVTLSFHPERYRPQFASYFISLLHEHFAQLYSKSLKRKAPPLYETRTF